MTLKKLKITQTEMTKKLPMEVIKRSELIGTLTDFIEEEKDGYFYGFTSNYIPLKLKGDYKINEIYKITLKKEYINFDMNLNAFSMNKILLYFSKTEWILWVSSIFIIIFSYLLFDYTNYLYVLVSIIGVTSLIISAKGNPIGQILMIVFSILYGIISYTYSYYGEMITYLGMTLPMSIFSFISWIRHPYDQNKREVKVNRINKTEIVFICLLTIVVTLIFNYILKLFNTTNLFLSTISVSTSFLAVYLSFRRSSAFALAYAANDLVLVFLWSYAVISNLQYMSIVICFLVFFVNDLYGFINWKKIERRQNT